MKKNRISLLLCAAVLALNVMSCGDAGTADTKDTAAVTNPSAIETEAVTEEAETVLPYNYELADFGGYEFVFLRGRN